MAAELGSGSGNCPSPVAMFLAAFIAFCPCSACCAIWEPDSIISTCTLDPSSFPQQIETHSYLLKPPELPAWQCCQLSPVPAGDSSHSPSALGPQLLDAAQMWRYPCVYWLEIWGNLFHEDGSSNSCLYCRDLSVGSQEAVERARSVLTVFRYYFLCKFLVPFWFPERRSGWVLEDSALLGGPFSHPHYCPVLFARLQAFQNSDGSCQKNRCFCWVCCNLSQYWCWSGFIYRSQQHNWMSSSLCCAWLGSL